jgi:hypothetical protein
MDMNLDVVVNLKARHLEALRRKLKAYADSAESIRMILHREHEMHLHQEYRHRDAVEAEKEENDCTQRHLSHMEKGRVLQEKLQEFESILIPATAEKIRKVEWELARLRALALERRYARKRELELIIACEQATITEANKMVSYTNAGSMIRDALIRIVQHGWSMKTKRHSEDRIRRAQEELASLEGD